MGEPKTPARSRRSSAAQRGQGRSRAASSLTLNMAPMIDMTFLLFSFVLVTASFERPEGVLASQLPQTSDAATVALPFSPIVIRVTQDRDGGAAAVTIDRFFDSPRPLAELPSLIQSVREQPGFDGDTPVVLVAQDAVRWDDVVECWNAALRSGCSKIAFAEER